MIPEEMGKHNSEWSKVLPDIDKQIEFIKSIRKGMKDKHIKPDVKMIWAIEQSLIAAKLFGKEKNQPVLRVRNEQNYINVLSLFKIRITTSRLEVLKAIFLTQGKTFTIINIQDYFNKNKPFQISKSSLNSIITLFKTRGLIKAKNDEMETKNPGRPSAKYIKNI
jgi:hypothetical protein